MAWLTHLAGLASPTPNITPVGSVASDLVTYILGYGVLGIVAIAFAFRLIVPARATEDARKDLVRENERLIAENLRVAEQRDAALKIAQDQIVPLLVHFTAATQSLLPLLQELVTMREVSRDPEAGRGRR